MTIITVDTEKIRDWLFSRAQMHQDRFEWQASFEDLYLSTAFFRGDFAPDFDEEEEDPRAILRRIVGTSIDLGKAMQRESGPAFKSVCPTCGEESATADVCPRIHCKTCGYVGAAYVMW